MFVFYLVTVFMPHPVYIYIYIYMYMYILLHCMGNTLYPININISLHYTNNIQVCMVAIWPI